MLISIIVPVYNVGKYLDKCIQSIICQSYSDFELILVNDGSTDGSEIKCQLWKERDKRIILVNQENKGVSTARNVGIKIASGTYIAFVDADDYLDKDYLKEMVNSIQGEPIDIVICGYYYWRSGKRYEYSFFGDDRELSINDRSELIKMAIGVNVNNNPANKKSTTNIGGPYMKLIRRDFIECNSISFPADLKRMQDMLFSIRCFSKLQNARYINRHLYNYVYRTDSAVNRYYSDFEYISEKILNEIKCEFKNAPLSEKEKDELIDYKAVLLLYETIKLQIAHPACPLGFYEKIREVKRICKKDTFSGAVKRGRSSHYGGTFASLFCMCVSLRLYGLVYLGTRAKMFLLKL